MFLNSLKTIKSVPRKVDEIVPKKLFRTSLKVSTHFVMFRMFEIFQICLETIRSFSKKNGDSKKMFRAFLKVL